jgi:hypothetical protein
MHSSHPKKTMTIDSKGNLVTMIIADRDHLDNFTPQKLTEESPGIDPVSLKWILNRMSPETITQLIETIMNPLPGRQYYLSLEQLELLQLAYSLVKEIALVFEEKFDRALKEQWKSKELQDRLL